MELAEKYLQSIHRLYGWDYNPAEEAISRKRKKFGWITERYILEPLGLKSRNSISDILKDLPYPPPIRLICEHPYVKAQLIAVTAILAVSDTIDEFEKLYKKGFSN